MTEELNNKIKAFAESTMTEEDRSPGLVYQSLTRANNLTDSQLIFNRQVLETYYSKGHMSETEYSDLKHSLNTYNELIYERYKQDNIVKWEYVYCPYFTLNEMPTSLVYNIETSIPERGRPDPEEVTELNYGEKIKDLEFQIKDTEDPDEIARAKSDMINLGWNPEVEFSDENIAKAKDRVERLYTEEMNDFCDIINISEDISIFDSSNYVLNESTQQSDSVPLYIIVSEDSIELSSSIHNPKVESSIYNVFVNRNIRDHAITLESTYGQFTNLLSESGVFKFPDNFRVYQVVAALYETYSFSTRAVIYKIKSNNQELSESILNKYCIKMCENCLVDIDINDYRIYTNASLII